MEGVDALDGIQAMGSAEMGASLGSCVEETLRSTANAASSEDLYAGIGFTWVRMKLC